MRKHERRCGEGVEQEGDTMSAYSDYKHGLITLDQYRAAAMEEAARDEWEEERRAYCGDDDNEEEEDEDEWQNTQSP